MNENYLLIGLILFVAWYLWPSDYERKSKPSELNSRDRYKVAEDIEKENEEQIFINP